MKFDQFGLLRISAAFAATVIYLSGRPQTPGRTKLYRAMRALLMYARAGRVC